MPPRTAPTSRRKTRKTATAEIEAEAEDALQDTGTPPPQGILPFTIGPLLSDVDIRSLSEYFPDASLESPSPELVIACYKVIIEQKEKLNDYAEDIENLKAEADRKDVELDQALQDRERVSRELEEAGSTVQEELKVLKEEKNQLAASRASLETQLSTISSSQSVSTSELDSLKGKIEEIDKEKRELLGVVTRLEEDAAQREDEIVQLRDSLKSARKENQDLESSLRDIRSSERSTTFKVETLTHQLQLAREESERTNNELTKKTEELSTLRRDKHTEKVQLQSELDSIKQTHNQTVASLRALQQSHGNQTNQLSQALQKVHDMNNRFADQEAKYASEAANLKRLISMMEERDENSRQLVATVERDWAAFEERATSSERKLKEALAEEQQRTAELEKELDDLRLVMDRVNKGELPLPSSMSAEMSPSPNASADGLLNLSPNLAMISRMQKSGKSFTQVYADYVRMQAELSTKTLEIDRLDRTLTEVLAELEERAPALVQQKIEIERVQEENRQLAVQLSKALSDRDGFLSQLRESNQKFSDVAKENKLMQQQLEDLGRQLKTLLKELGRINDPTLPSEEEMENIAPAENIDAVITNSLVLYRSIPQLQEQNQKLLKIVRELGAKMETEERDYKEQMDQEQSEAMQEAHDAIHALQEQLESQQKSHQVTVQAYIKERDALKTMLSRLERGDSSVSQSTQAAPKLNGHVQETSELEAELDEVRKSFDAYREEMGVDTVKLREEALQYQREANQLGLALAKANAKIEFLNDRQRMAQEQYVSQEREVIALTKRNQQLHEQYTRLDIGCNHASEELSVALQQIDRLRNDCALLRSEKQVWESIQSRLLDENKSLAVERSRLADLLGNVQKMHNDFERANESDRRRLESHIQSLENQAGDLRSQLSIERENLRQINLQKDIETNELRTKIDRMTEDVVKARENFAGAEASRQHLQDRVNDLLKQIKGNEEKISVYERKMEPSTSTSSSEGQDVEQQLKSEVAELRAKLKAAEVDLETARGHVQQFQEISQASEAALQSLSSSYDEYKASTESQIIKLENEKKSLDEKIKLSQGDLARLNEKNTEIQQTLEKERSSFAADKKLLEETIIDITNSGANSQADQAAREDELKKQRDRAKRAEDKYEREVVAHAESIKAVEGLKKELTKTRASVREKSLEAETAQANFNASEASWKQQKETLDKEIEDLNARAKDLAAQNTMLHQHLESVSSQAEKIRQTAEASNVVAEGDSDGSDDRMTELRSVIAFLRKEKDIVDLQLELSKQENARLKTQLEHLSKSVEETRATLSKEREEALKAAENSQEHVDLIEKINQLNILRESNATLRAESDANVRKSRQLEAKLARLQTELNPLKEEVTALRAEKEAKDGQIKRLEDENQQWKERNSQLLVKYDRIDPNDVQALKDEIEDLQIDLRKAEEDKAVYTKDAEAQTKLLEDTQTTLNDFRNRYTALTQQSRERLGQLNAQIGKLNETVSDLRKQLKDVTAEKEQLAKQTTTGDTEGLQTQLNAIKAEKQAVEQRLAEESAKLAKAVAEHQSALNALQEERNKHVSETSTSAGSQSAAPADNADAVQLRQKFEAEKAELVKARDEALALSKNVEARLAKALNESRNVRLQNEKFQARIAENEKRKLAENERVTALVGKHKQEQEEAVAAATSKLRAELQTGAGGNVEEIAARHAAELRDLEAKLVAKHEEELKAALEKVRQEGSQAVAATQSDKEGISAEEHEQALKAATERGRMEMTAKLKLKDTMLQKAQGNVKHLEAQIKAWREAGIIPSDAPTLPPVAGTPAKPATAPTPMAVKAQVANAPAAKPSPIASTSAAAPAVPSPVTVNAGGPPTASPATLPKKPVANAAVTAAEAVPTARGGARGLQRGGRGGRGVARGAARGGAPAALAQAAASVAAADPGVSIMGAAAKRTREESDAAESLAKRIKPAEGSQTKPVALRRDRISTVTTPAPPT